jgi:hypothetical protein
MRSLHFSTPGPGQRPCGVAGAQVEGQCLFVRNPTVSRTRRKNVEANDAGFRVNRHLADALQALLTGVDLR